MTPVPPVLPDPQELPGQPVLLVLPEPKVPRGTRETRVLLALPVLLVPLVPRVPKEASVLPVLLAKPVLRATSALPGLRVLLGLRASRATPEPRRQWLVPLDLLVRLERQGQQEPRDRSVPPARRGLRHG